MSAATAAILSPTSRQRYLAEFRNLGYLTAYRYVLENQAPEQSYKKYGALECQEGGSGHLFWLGLVTGLHAAVDVENDIQNSAGVIFQGLIDFTRVTPQVQMGRDVVNVMTITAQEHRIDRTNPQWPWLVESHQPVQYRAPSGTYSYAQWEEDRAPMFQRSNLASISPYYAVVDHLIDEANLSNLSPGYVPRLQQYYDHARAEIDHLAADRSQREQANARRRVTESIYITLQQCGQSDQDPVAVQQAADEALAQETKIQNAIRSVYRL